MKYDARKQLYEDQEQSYHNARWNWKDTIESTVRNKFSAYISKLPDLRITVDSGWGEVTIRIDYEHLHNDAFSLNWDYTIRLREDGEIIKESSSWSGLKAVTSEQIDDLLNSANLLKAIVEFDWAPVLEEAKKTQPKYRNYVGVRDPNYDPDYKDPGYDKMIREAEVDEALNSGKWIKGKQEYGENVWYFIVAQTPKFYNITAVREDSIRYALRNPDENSKLLDRVRNPQNTSEYYINRVKKDNLYFASPIETRTGEELIQSVQQSMTE